MQERSNGWLRRSAGLADRLRSPAVVNGTILVLAGLVSGLAIGLIFSSKAAPGATLLAGVLVAAGTYRTIQVTREGQITNRITEAVKQLAARNGSNPDEVVVLGGIYALERIARESKADYGPIMENLAAYVRGQVGIGAGQALREDPKPPNDVQAVLAVLGRREPPPDGTPGLDLTYTDLRCAKLPRAQLYDALLEGANLSHADLRDAKLIGAKWAGATFTGAHLARADFGAIDADFAGADGPHCTPAADRCEELDDGERKEPIAEFRSG